ncbi:Z1 domain-containing protein [Peribacillus frigoritolerans]|uniref:Z1 domain-containing protein n=1 Tax=Peribacillus frigoritolerans TaxID=450367 RepID=UPI00222E5047|nr:Z1 domain-containing protein [Peribacillus frigoritolerans]UZD48707.1 Z1 domain-containing protein [Peribacillus frigoritolerans]
MIEALKEASLVLIDINIKAGKELKEAISQGIDQMAMAFPGLTLEEKQQAKDDLFKKLKPNSQQGALLKNKDDVNHKAWYKEKKEHIDFKYWNRYRKYLVGKKNWSIDVVNKLDDSTEMIMELLEDPTDEDRNFDRRGLAFGYVQSGKTAHFTGVINKAIDAGYKLIIVLAGMHNDLRSQTQMRLDEEVLGYENSVKHTNKNKANRIGVGTLIGHEFFEVDSPTDRSENGDFQSKRALTFNKQIMVVKKNARVLEKLLAACQNSPKATYVPSETEGKSGHKVIHNVPILIIDDEADQASVDTSNMYDENNEIREEYDPKAINSNIRQIYNTFSQRVYLGYTATPFANILINQEAATTLHGQDLFPRDFILNLPKAYNYVGPLEYFLPPVNIEDEEETADQKTNELPFIKNIVYDNDFAPERHKKTFKPSKVPQSLVEAMYSFILAVAIRRYRGQDKVHNSMLIHVTRFKDVQEEIKALVNEMKREIQDDVENSEWQGEHSLGLQQHFDNEFNQGKLDFIQENFPNQFDSNYYSTWEDIKPLVLGAIKSISIKSLNGNSADTLEYKDYSETGLNVIAIGGDKLSRGLTLEGLTVSYYLRASKMYDTLMQMGRWFGFRQNFLDVCRLYITEDLVGWFQHVAYATEDLRAQLDYMAEIKAEPKEFLLRLQSHQNLLITSQNKMRSARQFKVNYSNELIQTTVFPVHDQEFYRNNYLATRNLIESIDQTCTRNPKVDMRIAREISTHKHYYWTKIGAELIIEFLEQYKTVSSATKADSMYIAKYVKSLSNIGELVNWTVVLINTGGEEKQFTEKMQLQKGIKRTGIPDQIDDKLTSIKTATSGDHIFFDFTEAMFKEAQDIKEKHSEKTHPKGTIALKTRALRKKTDALLILYPFNNEDENGSKLVGDLTYENESKPFAFAILTPETSAKEAEVDYVVNDSVVLEREEEEYAL